MTRSPRTDLGILPLFEAVDERWRTEPTDLGGWANRATQMKQLAQAAQRVIDCYEAIEHERPVRDFDEALHAYALMKERLA